MRYELVTVSLDRYDLCLLIEALEAHIDWSEQLAEEGPALDCALAWLRFLKRKQEEIAAAPSPGEAAAPACSSKTGTNRR